MMCGGKGNANGIGEDDKACGNAQTAAREGGVEAAGEG